VWSIKLIHNTQILFWLVCTVIQNIKLENDATLSVIKTISTFTDLSPTDDIVCFAGCCHAWRGRMGANVVQSGMAAVTNIGSKFKCFI
jgi:hypothetical protein